MSEENALPAGTILRSGRNLYTIKRVIGAGGFGITYCAGTKLRAGNLEFDVEVAIKEFFMAADCMRDDSTSAMICSKPAQERVSQARKDFLGEARRLNAISSAHPNIVRVNEVFEANNTAYYVMEYLEGQSLADYVASRGGRLSQEETLAIMMPMVDAVAFLHGERITHLDIKPANIMLAVDGSTGTRRPVLIDFGLSKHYDEKGQPTSTVNTRGFSEGYAPPEQYGGIDSFSPAADVYSLSATILYCLTGRRLPKSLSVDQEQIEAEIPAALSADLRAALRGGLQLNARRRIPHASALKAALSGLTQPVAYEDTIPAPQPVPRPYPRPTPRPDPKPKPRTTSRTAIYIAIAATAIINGAVLFFLLRGNGSDSSEPTAVAPPDTAELVQPTEPEVIVPEGMVDLGLSVYWAEKCVDNATPASKATLLKKLDASHRLPTKAEWQELLDRCTWTWQSSPAGYRVTAPNGHSIFLPAAGAYDPDSKELLLKDDYGPYWAADKNCIFAFSHSQNEIGIGEPPYGYVFPAIAVMDK